jgi:hypothetical protein
MRCGVLQRGKDIIFRQGTRQYLFMLLCKYCLARQCLVIAMCTGANEKKP